MPPRPPPVGAAGRSPAPLTFGMVQPPEGSGPFGLSLRAGRGPLAAGLLRLRGVELLGLGGRAHPWQEAQAASARPGQAAPPRPAPSPRTAPPLTVVAGGARAAHGVAEAALAAPPAGQAHRGAAAAAAAARAELVRGAVLVLAARVGLQGRQRP